MPMMIQGMWLLQEAFDWLLRNTAGHDDVPRLVLGLPHKRTGRIANAVRREHDGIDRDLLGVAGGD